MRIWTREQHKEVKRVLGLKTLPVLVEVNKIVEVDPTIVGLLVATLVTFTWVDMARPSLYPRGRL